MSSPGSLHFDSIPSLVSLDGASSIGSPDVDQGSVNLEKSFQGDSPASTNDISCECDFQSTVDCGFQQDDIELGGSFDSQNAAVQISNYNSEGQPLHTSSPKDCSAEEEEYSDDAEVARISDEEDNDVVNLPAAQQTELSQGKVARVWRRPMKRLYKSMCDLNQNIIEDLLKLSDELYPYGKTTSKSLVIDKVQLPHGQAWLILSGIREFMQAVTMFPLRSPHDFVRLRKKFGFLRPLNCDWLRFEAFLKHLSAQEIVAIIGCKECEVVWRDTPVLNISGPDTLVEFSLLLLQKSVESFTLRSTLSAMSTQFYPISIPFFLKPSRSNREYSAVDSTVPAIMGGYSGSTSEEIAEKLVCKHFPLVRDINNVQRSAIREICEDKEVSLIRQCHQIASLVGTIFTNNTIEEFITEMMSYKVVEVFCGLFPIATNQELLFWLGLAVFMSEYELEAFGIVITQCHSDVYRMIMHTIKMIEEKDIGMKVMGNFDIHEIKAVLDFESVLTVVPIASKTLLKNTAVVVLDTPWFDDSISLCCRTSLGSNPVVLRYTDCTGTPVALFASADDLPGEAPTHLPSEGTAEIQTQAGEVTIDAYGVENITRKYSTDAEVYFGDGKTDLMSLSKKTRQMVQEEMGQQPEVFYGKV